MKKKNMLIMLLLSLALILVGCGGNNSEPESDTSSQETTEETEESSDTDTEKSEITIGTLASMEPMVTPLIDQLNEQGYEAEVVLYEANQMPAESLNNADIDAVIANHSVWINTFNEENNGSLEMVEPYICYSPLGFYSEEYDSVEELPDNAVITIPGDASNISRSLYFLEDMGLITLSEKDENEFYNATHIEENPKNIEIMETEITALATTYTDADGTINFPSQMQHADIDVSEPLELDPQMMDYALGLIINSEETSTDDQWVQDSLEIFETDEYRDAFNEVFEDTYYTEW